MLGGFFQLIILVKMVPHAPNIKGHGFQPKYKSFEKRPTIIIYTKGYNQSDTQHDGQQKPACRFKFGNLQPFFKKQLQFLLFLCVIFDPFVAFYLCFFYLCQCHKLYKIPYNLKFPLDACREICMDLFSCRSDQLQTLQIVN